MAAFFRSESFCDGCDAPSCAAGDGVTSGGACGTPPSVQDLHRTCTEGVQHHTRTPHPAAMGFWGCFGSVLASPNHPAPTAGAGGALGRWSREVAKRGCGSGSPGLGAAAASLHAWPALLMLFGASYPTAMGFWGCLSSVLASPNHPAPTDGAGRAMGRHMQGRASTTRAAGSRRRERQ